MGFIVISHGASRRIRPSRSFANPLCYVPLPWPHSSSSSLLSLSPFRLSFATLSSVSPLLFVPLASTPMPFNNHSHPLSLIYALANSTTLLFDILCCHLILSIRLRHWHWKLFSLRSSAFVIFHVSQPYNRTGRTKALNRRILVLLPIPLAAHI